MPAMYPITFEAYLGDMGSYYLALAHIRDRGRGFYWNGQIFVEYRQKLSITAMTRQATNHMRPYMVCNLRASRVLIHYQ